MSHFWDHLEDLRLGIMPKLYMILYRSWRGYGSPVSRHKPTVVIIPGISSSWGTMKQFINFIFHSGYPVQVIPSLKYNLFSIEASAALVRQEIDSRGIGQAIIVGHSKGGLIGKYVLDFLNQDNKIKGLVAVCPPFHGSHYARYVPHPAFAELLPDSPSIKKLESYTARNSHIISIYPEWDNKINSELGSALPGARKNIMLALRGHNIPLFDRTSRREILAAIEELSTIPA